MKSLIFFFQNKKWNRKYETIHLFSFIDKFQVVHDKQQHLSGPGGSFGYGGGGRRTARGGAYFPASFVWCSWTHNIFFYYNKEKIFFSVRLKQNRMLWWTQSSKETFSLKLVIHLHIDNIRMNEETIAFNSHPSRLALASTLLQSNQWTC
jgi:hypothetical protein